VRRRKSRNAEGEHSEIDLTPMLDVVFIMLIFFIVTASFVKESTIDLNVPDSQKNTPPPDSKNKIILVTITSTDDIFIGGRRVDARAVRANIERLHAESPNAPVVVSADAKATSAAFIAVADAAREANVYEVSLVALDGQ